ncbi:hypothetical protein BJF82_14925 [Kytococcus sp. CUA-901]|nr:hypothetical protein BJF82_14925 [Kytococcus sp. CUA-901]
MPDCLAEQPEDIDGCGMPRAQGYRDAPPWTGRDDLPGNVSFVDLIDGVCTDETCPPIVGDVVVYSDHSHLTATYVRTLAPMLDAELRRVAPQLYR